MTEHVALLRGVNVGGITVRSADLRELFHELGFEDARTFLASGNVRFTAHDGDHGELKSRIQNALRERFGYDAWILLPTLGELRAAADAFPFDEADTSRHPYVIFCVDDATRDELVAAATPLDSPLDPVASGPGVVYWHPPRGRSVDTRFAKILGRIAYKSRTTNRNLRTLRKVLG